MNEDEQSEHTEHTEHPEHPEQSERAASTANSSSSTANTLLPGRVHRRGQPAPVPAEALADLSAAELSAGFAAGDLRPSAVAEAVLARIARREPELNALVSVDAEAVRRDAAASDARWDSGQALSALDGVPVTVKENLARSGVPRTGGTAIAHPPVSARNAPAVDRLLESGLVLLGSTTMPDWGMLSSGVSSRHGITRNALDSRLTSGGSSAGAGTAAAAGYGPLHLGTDIGGSIRLPGSWQGLVALKPSAGLVPLDLPEMGRAAGPLSRSAGDAVALMRVVAVPDARDFLAAPARAQHWSADPLDPAGLRVGLMLDAGSGLPVEAETRGAVLALAERFARAGARIEELPGWVSPEVLTGIVDFWRTRSWADYEELSSEDRAGVLPFIAEWCRAGASFDGAQTVRNRRRLDELAQRTRVATAGYDLVLSPVTPVAAFPAEWHMPVDDPLATMGHISFTVPHNMSGQPALSVPAGLTADGRTIGAQLAGPLGSDAQLLRLAAWIGDARA